MNTTITGTTQLDDLTLIAGIRQNNMKCYRLFQSRYFTYIKHLFSRWINDASDAEELSCDVMMKVITTIDRFDAAKGNMRLWIYVIAINTRNDYLRKLAAREQEAKTVSLDEPVTTGSDMLRIDFLVDTSADSAESSSSSAYTSNPALAAAQDVIKGLSADTRYILQMHEDGYTSSEIAETVHKPEGTIRSICSRIKKAIRAAYEKVMKKDVPARNAVVNDARSGFCRRGHVTAPAEIDIAEPTDECDVRSAPVWTREHGSRAARAEPLHRACRGGSRSESRDAPLSILAAAFPGITLIRRLLSYFGAVYKCLRLPEHIHRIRRNDTVAVIRRNDRRSIARASPNAPYFTEVAVSVLRFVTAAAMTAGRHMTGSYAGVLSEKCRTFF